MLRFLPQKYRVFCFCNKNDLFLTFLQKRCPTHSVQYGVNSSQMRYNSKEKSIKAHTCRYTIQLLEYVIPPAPAPPPPPKSPLCYGVSRCYGVSLC